MNRPVAILVRSDPYRMRAGRERLDLAMIAAALDLPVRVFFLGDGLLHLADHQAPGALPAAPFTKGWQALLELGPDVALFAEREQGPLALNAVLPITELDDTRLAEMLHECCMVLHV